MSRYDNYDDAEFNNGYPNNQNNNLTEYDTQNYDDSNYYDSNNAYQENAYFEEPFSESAYQQENIYAGNPFPENAYQEQAFDEQNNDYQQESIHAPLYSADYARTEEAIHNPKQSRYTDEPLTEAEIADMKRQKAAARRKKMAARERRRKKRMQQAIIRCSILLVIVILLIVGLVKLVSGIFDHFEKENRQKKLSEYRATSEVTTEEPVANIDNAIIAKELPTDRDAAMAQLTEQAATDTEIQGICDNAAALPDVVLRHLAANSELKDFAIKYPAKINIVFDGNFSVEVPAGEVPLYLQFDERWGYADYATDLVGLSGAGPTALSMVCTHLKNDGSMNPIKIADYATEAGYLDQDGNTHWTLLTEGAKSLGLVYEELDVNKEAMIKALKDNKLIICQVSSGDFTTSQSYIVIRDYKDAEGFFYINDPTSAARSNAGWDFRRLSKQIDRMFAYVAGTDDTSNDTSQSGDNQTGDTAGEDGQAADSAGGEAGQSGDSGQTGNATGDNEQTDN